MWDRRKGDNGPGQRPGNHQGHESNSGGVAVANGYPQQATQQMPQQAQPQQAFRPPEPVATGKGTAIGSGVSIVGDVFSDEDLFVDGEVKGRLELKNSRLTVGPKGKANSNIRAREVIIQGKVQGDVEASAKITIKKDGSLVGNIKTTGIVIDDDAYFKGSIDIVRKEGESSK